MSKYLPQFNSWVGKICWRRDRLPTPVFLGFPGGSAGKESARNAGDLGLIPELRRSSGEGKGYLLQYFGLENSTNYIVHSVANSRTQLRNLHFTSLHFTPLQGGTSGKEVACQYRRHKRCSRCGYDPWVGKIPCRREWHPTPLLLPGESH